MRMPSICRVALVVISLAALIACTQEPPPSRQDVLVSLTRDLIVPRFQSVSAEMHELRTLLHTLCADPNAGSLEAARTAWRDARAPWMRSQAMWFGPVMERRSRALVDWLPIDPERIESLLAERGVVTANDVREFLASTQRGLGAIEYLLFEDDRVVLERLGPSEAMRCQYLTTLGDVVAAETDAILAEWNGAGGSGKGYAAYFNGTGSVSLLDQQAVDELVRTSVFLTRSIVDMKLGKALVAGDGQPDPAAIPGGLAYHSVADMRNQVLGMQDVYLGAPTEPGLGVSVLVKGVSKDADDRMRQHFTLALAAIDALEEPLQTTIIDNPQPAQMAHQRLQELQRALNTEVVSLLGVTVGFADTDGDGG